MFAIVLGPARSGRRSIAEKAAIANAMAPKLVVCPDPDCSEQTDSYDYAIQCMREHGRCHHRPAEPFIGPTKQAWWIRALRWLIK